MVEKSDPPCEESFYCDMYSLYRSQLDKKLGLEHQVGHGLMSLGAGRVKGSAQGSDSGSLVV